MQQLHHALNTALMIAWEEIQKDTQHRLQLPTRLSIYDRLIGDLDVTMIDLAAGKGSRPGYFPQLTPGVYRYFYLGWLTVQRLIPLYDQQMRIWIAANYPDETEDHFAQMIMETGHRILTGATDEQITQWLETAYPESDYWWNWEMQVGNLDEILPYTSSKCLLALDHWLSAVIGRPPFFHGRPTDTYDDLKDLSDNRDVTPYAWAAIVSAASVPLHQLQEREPAFNRQASLEFWQWWLFGLVPQAAEFDHSTAGWHVNASRYNQ